MPARKEAALSDAELVEYRRLRPLLMQLLDEWQKVRTGCPIAKRMIE